MRALWLLAVIVVAFIGDLILETIGDDQVLP